MFDLRSEMIMLSLKCLKQYFSVKFVLKIQFSAKAICEKTVLRMRLRISFFFDVLFDNALNTVSWIFSSVIWENSNFSKYVAFAISSILTSVNDEKKNSFKQCALFVFVKVVLSFDLRSDDMLNLKRIFLFFAHLINFHVFWAFSVVSSTAFRWFLFRTLFIVLFLLFLTFFHAFWASFMIFFFSFFQSETVAEFFLFDWF